jgi:non-lysosomal glucosylceramidase
MPSPTSIPPSAWSRRFDEEPLLEASSMKVSLKVLWEQLPVIVRLGKQIREDRKQGHPPVLDTIHGVPFNPDKGIPLGGLGGGTVTRGFRGDFNRWQLQPGITRFDNVLADQFSLFAQRPGAAAHTQVLVSVCLDCL